MEESGETNSELSNLNGKAVAEGETSVIIPPVVGKAYDGINSEQHSNLTGKAVAEGETSVIIPPLVRKTYDEILEKIQKLNAAPSSASASASSISDPFIFRAPSQLRQINERAFDPQIISIGPYHRNTDKYQKMETLKFCYLREFIQRLEANQSTLLLKFVTDAESMEETARNCYEGITLDKMSSDEFVKMMVLDGLFIVELLCKFHYRESRKTEDYLFKRNFNLTIVAHDLLLLENQLPFFVLNHFFKTIKQFSTVIYSFDFMAIYFFSMMLPAEVKGPEFPRQYDDENVQDIKHLLGLVHNHCLPLPPHQEYTITVQSSSLDVVQLDQWELDKIKGNLSFIRSATGLSEAGIKFKKRNGNSLFDIKFEREKMPIPVRFSPITILVGQLHIPTLIVDNDTERIFRNLIAYEQLHPGSSIVMDYTRLMDCLINYAEDVALLSNSGIIDNRLGSNEDAANMFNKLNDFVYLSTANFYYSKLFHDVNKHCNRPWNLWKMKLRRKYFNTPWHWVLTSIFVASILLILTFLQTLYSVLSYYK